MARIDELLDKHSQLLDKLTDKEAAVFLRTYRSGSKDLAAKLAKGATPGQEQTLRIQLSQLRSGVHQLEDRLGTQLDASTRTASEKALADMLGVVRLAEPNLGEVAGLMEVAALRRLSKYRGLALHRYSVERYGRGLIEALQRDLVTSTQAGEGVYQLEQRLRKSLASQEHRAWLIARMELSRAYNDSAMESITAVDELTKDGMLKRIHETADKRNHPFSRAAHGVVAKSGELFKVPAATVLQAGAYLGKSTGGILWKRRGANFVGMNLPAHFGERGRVVPWRAAWAKEDTALADVDKPLVVEEEGPKEGEFPHKLEDLESLGRNGLGGMHNKVEIRAPDGSRWMFKPYSHRKIGGVDQSFRAHADKVTADFAKATGQAYSETHVVTLPKGHPALRSMDMDRSPVTGSMQRLNTEVSGQILDTAPSALSRKQLNQVQREHVLDWVISNHDSHGENFLFTKDVGMLGIDKGQAFRFFGRDAIGTNYNPNPVASWYNRKFGAYAEGKYGRDFAIHGPKKNRQLGAYIRKIQEMPEEEFLAIFEPYIQAADQAGVKWADGTMDARAFRLELLGRRERLRTTMDNFYTSLEHRRGLALDRLAPETVTKLDKAFLETAVESGFHGRVAHLRPQHFRSGELLFHGMKGNGAVGEAFLSDAGNSALMKALGRSRPERVVAAVVDPYAQDMTKLLKSITAHIGAPGHSVYDGAIPSHTKDLWDQMLQKLWLASRQGDKSAIHHWAYLDQHFLKPHGLKLGSVLDKPAADLAVLLKPGAEKIVQTKAFTTAHIPEKVANVVKDKAGRLPFTVREIATTEWNTKLADGVVQFGSEVGQKYGNGHTYEIAFRDRPFRVLYAHKEDSNLHGKSGRLRVVYDKPVEQLTPDDLASALEGLKELGLDSELAQLVDMEVLYLLKTTRVAGLSAEPAFMVAPGADSGAVVKQLRGAWSDRLGKDVSKLPGYKPLPEYRGDPAKRWGSSRWERFDITEAQINKAGLRLYHDLDYGGGSAETFVNAAAPSKSMGLVPTEDKLRIGIPLGHGGSPEMDMAGGGSRFAYTRLGVKATSRANRVHFNPRLILDVDSMNFPGDQMGHADAVRFDSKHLGQNLSSLRRVASDFNETLVRGFLGFHHVEKLEVGSQVVRQRILLTLQDNGITHMGGKPVAQVVKVAR